MPTLPQLVCTLLATQLLLAPAIEPHHLRSAIPFSAAEPVSTREPQQPSTLKIESSLVPVRVVVRDSKGHTVAGLSKNDFQILDESKPQPISQFFAFSRSPAQSESPAQSGSHPQPTAAPAPASAQDPESIYTVYLFDDIHIEREDFSPARSAAMRHVASLPSSEYAALVTTSGQTGQDFTLDHDKLRQSFANLTPQDRLGDCLKLTYYQGNEIENEQNDASLNGAIGLALTCGAPTPAMGSHPAQVAAESAAKEAVEVGRADTARSLFVLRRLIRRMSKAPGQRKIILISNGIFFEHSQPESEVIDLALRGNVTVNALDPAGLQPPDADNSGPSQQPGDEVTGAISQQTNQNANWALLKDLTVASGGTFFHGNNDLDEGFRRVAGAPEYSYLLAFAPDPSNKPGRTHKLKVTLIKSKSLKIQARTAYFAPAKK